MLTREEEQDVLRMVGDLDDGKFLEVAREILAMETNRALAHVLSIQEQCSNQPLHTVRYRMCWEAFKATLSKLIRKERQAHE